MLSAIIITKDEEKCIGRCLSSLAFVDEKIVVDSGSRDRTREIATSLGAQVYQNPWLGYGQQKNLGAAQAKGEWLLFIDADEEVTPELRDKILAVTGAQKAPYDIYWLRIVTIFLNKRLRHLYGHNARLYKKGAAEWTHDYVHERVSRNNNGDSLIISLGDNDTGLIETPLLHYSHENIRSYLKSMHLYTDLEAKTMSETFRHRSGRKVKPHWWLPSYLATRQIVKLLIYRRGILDGCAGWAWCLLSSYYEWEMACKFVRLTNLKSKA